jgi:hypothetical protein
VDRAGQVAGVVGVAAAGVQQDEVVLPSLEGGGHVGHVGLDLQAAGEVLECVHGRRIARLAVVHQ